MCRKTWVSDSVKTGYGRYEKCAFYCIILKVVSSLCSLFRVRLSLLRQPACTHAPSVSDIELDIELGFALEKINIRRRHLTRPLRRRSNCVWPTKITLIGFARLVAEVHAAAGDAAMAAAPQPPPRVNPSPSGHSGLLCASRAGSRLKSGATETCPRPTFYTYRLSKHIGCL